MFNIQFNWIDERRKKTLNWQQHWTTLSSWKDVGSVSRRGRRVKTITNTNWPTWRQTDRRNRLTSHINWSTEEDEEGEERREGQSWSSEHTHTQSRRPRWHRLHRRTTVGDDISSIDRYWTEEEEGDVTVCTASSITAALLLAPSQRKLTFSIKVDQSRLQQSPSTMDTTVRQNWNSLRRILTTTTPKSENITTLSWIGRFRE